MKYIHLTLAALILCLFAACSSNQTASDTPQLALIPQPSEIHNSGKMVELPSAFEIKSESNDAFIQVYTQILNENLVALIKNNSSAKMTISLSTKAFEDESAYKLSITDKSVEIAANGKAGWINGLNSLHQLIYLAATQNKTSIPQTTINDKSRFGWRGMHLDVSRHFFSLSEIENFIDELAFYKFNKLHLHLTDDQGWRLEIKKYPKLTTVGGWRKFNSQDRECMRLAKAEANPSFNIPDKHVKVVDGDSLYGGFYTQEEMKGIIEYANNRNIEIIPEIDMPGHIMSAIRAYPWLSSSDGAEWGKTFSVPMCPCEDRVMTFAKDVFNEVMDLFPSKYVHIGADEVEKTTWAKSDACKTLMEKEGIESLEELQSWFVRQMEAHFQSKGKQLIGWDEIIEGGLSESAVVMYWRSWVKDAPKHAVSQGNNIIFTPTDYCYFDYKQNSKTTESLYNYTVIPEDFTADEADKVLGVQANIWTEWIPSVARMQYMVYPRILALAEIAWTNESRDWNAFEQRLKTHYAILDQKEINYRIPDVQGVYGKNVFVDSTTVRLSLDNPNLTLRYETTDQALSNQSKVFPGELLLKETTKLKLGVFRPNGQLAESFVADYEKQDYHEAQDIESTSSKVNVKYVEGDVKQCADLDVLKTVKESVENGIVIPDYVREEAMGLEYKAFIEVPEDAVYTFFTQSDDGSVLYIYDKLVVDNDGLHGPIEKSGQIALKKGKHPIKLQFIEGGGGQSIVLRWQSPSLEKAEVPSTALSIVE